MATVLEPQQPTLRPFIVYDVAPAGCIPFLVMNDDTAPNLRPGDVALIDTAPFLIGTSRPGMPRGMQREGGGIPIPSVTSPTSVP